MPYHHGNLREALVGASLELARGGPDEVVLRAASREAGVSHNAAYRHFADRDDLLAAVRERCFLALGGRMQQGLAEVQASGDPVADAWQRLRAVGRAYLRFAVDEPGWFRTAFGTAQEAPAGGHAADPYALLNGALDELVAVGALPAERRPHAEVAAWAAVHGLASLLVDGPLHGAPADERETMLVKVLDVVSTGL